MMDYFSPTACISELKSPFNLSFRKEKVLTFLTNDRKCILGNLLHILVLKTGVPQAGH